MTVPLLFGGGAVLPKRPPGPALSPDEATMLRALALAAQALSLRALVGRSALPERRANAALQGLLRGKLAERRQARRGQAFLYRATPLGVSRAPRAEGAR